MRKEAEEIVERNSGEINDLINHIEQELHVNSILSFKMDNSIFKRFLQEKVLKLQLLKTELQQALEEYNQKSVIGEILNV